MAFYCVPHPARTLGRHQSYVERRERLRRDDIGAGFLHAAHDKASLDNEQASVGLATGRGPVLVRQIAGLIARRIVTDGKEGERAIQGDRMGMIRFGSRVDVFLPLAPRARVRARVGERVQAGVTVLAEYGP